MSSDIFKILVYCRKSVVICLLVVVSIALCRVWGCKIGKEMNNLNQNGRKHHWIDFQSQGTIEIEEQSRSGMNRLVLNKITLINYFVAITFLQITSALQTDEAVLCRT